MLNELDFQDKVILVTGGCGFIGSHIVDFCIHHGAFIRVVDDMSNGSLQNIENHSNNSKLEIIRADIRDQKRIEEIMDNAAIVFHQAARVSVSYSLNHPVEVNDVNSNGTTIILNAAKKKDVKKVVVASSSSVYGDTAVLPKVENMMTNPLSPYASSKLSAESMALAFSTSYNMHTSVLRYFNVYGPRQRSGVYAGVISTFIDRALNNSNLQIEGDGNQTRDFTFVNDVVIANILASLSKKSAGRVYNIGSGRRTSINDLAKLIIRLTKSSSKIEHHLPRAGDVRHSQADISKAKSDLGYAPSTNLQKGLLQTIEWMKSRSKK